MNIILHPLWNVVALSFHSLPFPLSREQGFGPWVASWAWHSSLVLVLAIPDLPFSSPETPSYRNRPSWITWHPIIFTSLPESQNGCRIVSVSGTQHW